MKIEYQLTHQPYKGILFLLVNYPKKIKFLHLRYQLIENHDGIQLKTQKGRLTKKAKIIYDCFGNLEELEERTKRFKGIIKKHGDVTRNIMVERDFFLNPKITGKAPSNQLNNDLRRMQSGNEPLITKISGTKIYAPTYRGYLLFHRHYFHWFVDTIFPDKYIPALTNFLKEMGRPQEKYHQNMRPFIAELRKEGLTIEDLKGKKKKKKVEKK